MATWSNKRKMYMTALIITQDVGAQAQPCGQEIVQHSKGGGKDFMEWAIDFRRCSGNEIFLQLLDDYYGQESKGYHRVPMTLRPVLRMFWKEVYKRRLLRQGERIVNLLYEDGYAFY